jgi:hypothetical protein
LLLSFAGLGNQASTSHQCMMMLPARPFIHCVLPAVSGWLLQSVKPTTGSIQHQVRALGQEQGYMISALMMTDPSTLFVSLFIPANRKQS